MKDYFLLAFNNLRRRKLRSWLTMIGIFIGIAAVVGLISIGQGMQNAINEQFEQLGGDKIIIQPKLMGPPGSATSDSLILKSKDLEFIEDINGVEWAVGYLMKSAQTIFKDEAIINFVIGIDPEDLELIQESVGSEIIDGRNLEAGDKYSVVVGYNHANGDKIWERPVKLRDKIMIEGIEFKVVGVYEKIGNPFDDAAIYMPKETMKEVLGIEDEESQIVVKVESDYDPADVAETIKEKLRRFRGEKEDQETFGVQTSEQLLDSFSSIFAVVQGVLVGIAAISLLVGAVGIMNTMYTSVLERTKEIGVMKAIGAKNKDVLMIFLFESGLLGLVGGAIGVVIGIGLSKGAEYLATVALGTNLLQADTSLTLICGALAFSFLIGTASGILPAMQAAKLKPADALRYE